MQPVNNSEKTGGGQFKPGQSGNPSGRPKGIRSKVTVLLDALADGEAEEIARVMIDNAKKGDAMAARAILDRVWPARKGARVQFDLPDVTRAEELPGAIAAVNRQVADGVVRRSQNTRAANPTHRAEITTHSLIKPRRQVMPSLSPMRTRV
ncbi:MAG: hypothetical protein ABS35_15440 [Kaistia sp. SCN 65-12]|nr:MAG: hypothetical protein ABS35_15440 [Kaistia sp. SCN 65-12]